jgi:hypothetical protein
MHVKLKFERILDMVIGSLIHTSQYIYIYIYIYSSEILLEIAIRQWMWIGGFPRLVAKQFVIYLNIQRLQHYSTLIGHCTLWDNGKCPWKTIKKYVIDTHEGSLGLKKVLRENRNIQNLTTGVVTQWSWEQLFYIKKTLPVLLKPSRTSHCMASVAEGRVLNTDLLGRELIKWVLKILCSQFSFDIII